MDLKQQLGLETARLKGPFHIKHGQFDYIGGAALDGRVHCSAGSEIPDRIVPAVQTGQITSSPE